MEEKFYVVTAEHCFLREAPGVSPWQNDSGITDEIFSGWAVRAIPEQGQALAGEEPQGQILPEQGQALAGEEPQGQTLPEQGQALPGEEPQCRALPEEGSRGWMRIETHYGYVGYVRQSELMPVSRQELTNRQDRSRFFRIGAGEADLLDRPKVQGLPLELLLKNALVERIQDVDSGWSLVRSAAGREGYIHTKFLRERMDDDGYLLETVLDDEGRVQWMRADRGADVRQTEDGEGICGAAEPDADGKQKYFLRRFLAASPDEVSLRACLVRSARAYLGTQYRWGGKSSQGLDCSGLVFMSYLENGVLIYRDAGIKPDYPVHGIAREQLKPGDLLFFPGHVAMYIGEGRYIHSTAAEKTPCVTINSLNPSDPDYRDDLAHKITACGSVF